MNDVYFLYIQLGGLYPNLLTGALNLDMCRYSAGIVLKLSTIPGPLLLVGSGSAHGWLLASDLLVAKL